MRSIHGSWWTLAPALLISAGCGKSEAPVTDPTPVVTALDGLFQSGTDSPLTWRAYITGSVLPPALPAGFEPLARGYLSVRIDLKLPSGELLPVAGVFVPDSNGDRLAEADPLSSFPRTFADDRFQLRAELARRLAVAPDTVPSFPASFAGELGLSGDGLPALRPPASTCARALDPMSACASDEGLVEPFGLQAIFEVAGLRSYGREVPPAVAADLLLGQHPDEQKWKLSVNLPSPDGAAAEPQRIWSPVVVARVHAQVSALSTEGLSSLADLFGPIDTWGSVALMRLDKPPVPTAADQARFAADAKALAESNALPVAEGDFAVEVVELATTTLSGCQ